MSTARDLFISDDEHEDQLRSNNKSRKRSRCSSSERSEPSPSTSRRKIDEGVQTTSQRANPSSSTSRRKPDEPSSSDRREPLLPSKKIYNSPPTLPAKNKKIRFNPISQTMKPSMKDLFGSDSEEDNASTAPEDTRKGMSTRIVSGWEAEEGQIPWQLSLRMVNPVGNVNACGGSIIHRLWGMTAAHCTATRVTMVLRAGAVSLTRPELLFETTEYYNHPQYIDALQTVVQPNDIALLKFPRAITFSDRVQPIRVQRDEDRDRNYGGVRLEASGWGRTWTNGPAPENLQWVYLTGDSNPTCWLAFGGSSIIQDSTICASAYNVSSQSTCQGDSGGPLVAQEEDGKYTLVGVASFVSGAGCHADFPAGFIRPGHYHAWFREVTGLDFDWDYEEPTTVVPTTTEADSSSSSESSTNTEAPTTETTTEAENSSDSSGELVTSTTETVTESTEAAESVQVPEESRPFFSYFRSSFARF